MLGKVQKVMSHYHPKQCREIPQKHHTFAIKFDPPQMVEPLNANFAMWKRPGSTFFYGQAPWLQVGSDVLENLGPSMGPKAV